MPVQVSSSAEGASTNVNVPLQVADLPLQFPELADTDMPLYVPISGLSQSGALIQSKPLLISTPLQATVGGVIVMPVIPVEGTAAQVSVYATESDSLLELPPKSLPLPSSLSDDEQEKIKAKASTRLTTSASLANSGQADPARTIANCVLIILSLY
jgi:hypothetical protein